MYCPRAAQLVPWTLLAGPAGGEWLDIHGLAITDKLLQHAIYYFDPGNNYPIVHNAPAVAKSLERPLHWNVPLPVITEELRRQGVSGTIDTGANAE